MSSRNSSASSPNVASSHSGWRLAPQRPAGHAEARGASGSDAIVLIEVDPFTVCGHALIAAGLLEPGPIEMPAWHVGPPKSNVSKHVLESPRRRSATRDCGYYCGYRGSAVVVSLVGAIGFEPTTSASRTQRSSQAELRPGGFWRWLAFVGGLARLGRFAVSAARRGLGKPAVGSSGCRIVSRMQIASKGRSFGVSNQ